MLRRHTPLRTKPGHRDPVAPTLRIAVLQRDQGCVAARLGAPGECSGKLELDHVKDNLRAGRRAESSLRTLVSVCGWHHGTTRTGGGWATSKVGRAALREYLRAVA